MEYGQFCPIAKASEILGEKWTILIVRELLMGSCRFNELQRGLGLISPTILSKRLAMLDERGLVYRKRISGQRGYEYHPTESCKQLLPILLSLGGWGMQWARTNMTESDYDVELLMLYLERSILPAKLPGGENVIKFHFSDIDDLSDWWIVVEGDEVDVCTTDPGKDVDVHFNTTVRVMTEVWIGEITYRKAKVAGLLTITGPRALTGNVSTWLSDSVFADLPDAGEIVGRPAVL
ncbi:helix-turn-helix domain-containing protein [Pelagibius sp. Alg239-R121]|uniref:winged helix-turn-helix transcriptional regulator n=1 Tax=Pelagibius sp. Alg239-R121 TaxID=2993448 RepID=UPI0024A75ACC|nr:helix-turn-helix domain-containing protein [Pelagibius sp. Alg239-R121]